MKSLRMLVIKRDEVKDTVDLVEVKEQSEDTLSILQKNVGGYIELFPYNENLENAGIDCFVDDEGKIKQRPITMVVYRSRACINVEDLVAGDVVFVSHDKNGNTKSLSDKQVEIVKKEVFRINEAVFGSVMV